MFERFTADARAVVVGAQHEARELGHDYIGTEHVLLAMLDDPGGPVAAALAPAGVDAAFVRARIVGADPANPERMDEEDAAALRSIGIDLDEVRRTVEETFGAGALRLPRSGEPKRRRHVPFTRRNKKVLELSVREAARLRQRFIAPEHILLGMLRDGENDAGSGAGSDAKNDAENGGGSGAGNGGGNGGGMAVGILRARDVDLDALRTTMDAALRARAA